MTSPGGKLTVLTYLSTNIGATDESSYLFGRFNRKSSEYFCRHVAVPDIADNLVANVSKFYIFVTDTLAKEYLQREGSVRLTSSFR